MEDFRIATKYNKETEGQRCPKCNYIFKDFPDLGEKLGMGPGVLWICLDCGLVFMPQKARQGIKASLRILVEQQMNFEKEVKSTSENIIKIKMPWICDDCGYEAKSAAGLGAHRRKHKSNDSTGN